VRYPEQRRARHGNGQPFVELVGQDRAKGIAEPAHAAHCHAACTCERRARAAAAFIATTPCTASCAAQSTAPRKRRRGVRVGPSQTCAHCKEGNYHWQPFSLMATPAAKAQTLEVQLQRRTEAAVFWYV